MPTSFDLGTINGYDYKVTDSLFPVQPVPYVGQGFASNSNFRPYQVNLNSEHFLTSSAYFKNNALLIGAGLPTDLAPGPLSNSNYLMVDQSRFSQSKGTTLRVYSAQEPTEFQHGTYTMLTMQPFFSYTGCSWSINDDSASTRQFSQTCAFLAKSLSGDSSTVYVYGSYESNSANNTLLYWAQIPLQGTEVSGPVTGYGPVNYTLLKSDTQLLLTSISNPIYVGGTQRQRWVPLLPGEDWWPIAAYGSVTQYQSATGFGSWPSAGQPLGGSQGSFTSLSFIGTYIATDGTFPGGLSYSDFNPTLGSFFIRMEVAQNSGANSWTDNIFFCASTASAASSDPNVNYSCSAIAPRTLTDGYSTFSTNLATYNDETLFSNFGLVRGANAWASITSLLSISTARNIFSLTASPSNSITGVYDALLQSLVKGNAISDVQPQENLSLVYNASSTFWSTPPYYWKIPSVMNPKNIQFNSIFSTTVLSQTEVFLPGSATAAEGGFYNQVRAYFDPGTFQVTSPSPATVSFQFSEPLQVYSLSAGTSLTSLSAGDYAINFTTTQFDPRPTHYVDFYFRTFDTQINTSYSTQEVVIGGGGGPI
jgi:hypothetical protein